MNMPGTPNLHMDVLLADPDAARRAAATQALEAGGCRVRAYARAPEAVEACREAPPAVVLVDEDACRADDLRVIDAIKRDPDLFGIGVVVRSRHLDVDDALDGMARGAHVILVDPLADAELVTAVRSAARTGALQEELRNRAEALEQLAFSDGLTGLPNRRFLDRRLAAMISAANRHGRPFSVVLVDADRFKPVNDTHGHGVGDEVLTVLGERLRARLRTEDDLGRFGGEEFLALLPETEGEDAAEVADALREEVGRWPIDTVAGEIPMTVSAGWAVWREGEAAHELLARADEALYRAKEAGRNRVEGEVIAGRTSR
jgi:two-component system cell cycle response regulator